MNYDLWLDSADPSLYAEEPAGESDDESLCRTIEAYASHAEDLSRDDTALFTFTLFSLAA